MSISKQQVEHVARLARLQLSPAELDSLAVELTQILEYVATLQAVDTSGVAPLAHLGVAELPLRPDQVAPPLDNEVALSQAPRSSQGAFAVPTFMEEP